MQNSSDATRILLDSLRHPGDHLLAGMSEADRASVVNFFAYLDSDEDGLSDADEAAVGTDNGLQDTDGDGLMDGFEFHNGFNPLSPDGGEAAQDDDGDGLNNLDEQAFGTDPRAADSDGDGINDGAEVHNNGTDPLFSDTDHDGLSDSEEIAAGTDPVLSDSDSDGLSDADELRLHNTDPLVTDTDQDGMSDGFEISCDMTTANAADDPDQDGLSNAEESAAGSNPHDTDTDDDRVLDYWEVMLYGTNPSQADSDNGGRRDADELFVDQTVATDAADDLPTVSSSQDLFDENGRYWNAHYYNGRVRATSSNATSSAFELSVNDTAYNNSPHYQISQSAAGRELGYSAMSVGDLRVSRRVYVPATGGAFIRYLEVIHNPGEQAQEVSLELNSRYYGTNLEVVTSDGDNLLSDTDNYVIFRDISYSSRPILGHLFAGPNLSIGPDQQTARPDNNWNVNYRFTIPAGGRRMIMHLGIMEGTMDSAINSAEQLLLAEGAVLDHLTVQDQADIINFYAYADADQDGLSDVQEATTGTSSSNPDSDGDGLNDRFEVAHGLDPLSDAGEVDSDTDSDGLSALQEQQSGTDPNDPDSDNDLLNDGAESAAGTDPLNADTDQDGLTDHDEINSHNTDPLAVDSDLDGMDDRFEVVFGLQNETAFNDFDGDGLSNLAEFNFVTNPSMSDTDGDGLGDYQEIHVTETDPNNQDSDEDGLNDGSEIQTHNSNPLRRDSESDGLDDYQEVIVHLTDPNSWDTDGDGAGDRDEIEQGTDPLDSASVPDYVGEGEG
ncbi:MAG: hypothetical protein KZQ78_12860 [Candidatus Thiodiazotropha sp. (ex Ustalcina ferruginea)]|nr:hypothetical protein [Candidatus Thiodiazotropha sp. (ex Ustalcina ferruginea)]